jgi:Protein of unknown function (DUF1326)
MLIVLALQDVRPDYVSGLWTDACPCKVPCPCWRTGHSSAPDCVNLHVFYITHDTGLDSNLNEARFILLNIPVSSHNAPAPQALFIDLHTDDRRSTLIKALVSEYFGDVEVRRVPIDVSQQMHSQTASIPGVLDYQVQFPDEVSPIPEVADYLYPWLSKPVQGLTFKIEYTSLDGKKVRYSGTNAIKANFRMKRPVSVTAAGPLR